MTFTQSIETCFYKYYTFWDRASRSEFWWFQLFLILLWIAIGVAGSFLSAAAGGYMANILSIIYTLVTLLPWIAVSVRRLHDTDSSGWWLLLILIPIIGFIVLIIWWALEGSTGENKYGAPPQARRTLL